MTKQTANSSRKSWQPIPNTENSAWNVASFVVRKQHDAYFVRKDNGTGYGNGDLLTVCHNTRQVNAFISAQVRS